MNDDIIKRAARASVSEASPTFESVLASRQRRRVRTLRAGLVAVLIIAATAAPFVLRPSHPETEFALLTPPTTDWLLETPDPQWVAQLNQNTPRDTPEEPSHVH
jgi:hypothetical protein